jgi:hypothetical protein
MRALLTFLAMLAAVGVQAGDERTSLSEFTRAHMGDVAIVEGSGGAGSAFIARIGKGRYLITNQHVVAGMDVPVFTKPDRTRLKIGTAAAAEGHDVMAFGIDQEGSALEAMQNVDRHVAIGDEVAVLGNPSGEGVIHPLSGKIVGLGPQLVEVSAEFVPGNSGSPIIHVRTGKVIAVASYLIYEPIGMQEEGTRQNTRTRRFGYRLDSIQKWLPVRMWEFNDEGATVKRIRERTKDLTTIIVHMRANRSLSANRLVDPEVRALFERFSAESDRAVDLPARTKNATLFLEGMLQVSTADISHARRRISYDYFLGQLDREVEAREPFPRILSTLLKAQSLPEPVATSSIRRR